MAAFLVVGGGSGPSGPRALTSDEVNRLAITRFRNYEAHGRAVTITVPGTAGGLVVTGSVDYHGKLGYGVVHGTGRDTSSDGLIEWTPTSVFVHPMANAPAHAPASPPRSAWHSRPLLSSGSALDTSLAIALKLGSDRPDNAALLPQNGAAWWGRDEVDGHRVDVMTGPSSPAAPVRRATSATGSARRHHAPGPCQRGFRVAAGGHRFRPRKYVPVKPVPGVTPTR